jgi:hypothetical protein
MQGRTTSLNRSTHKMKSSNFMQKSHSPHCSQNDQPQNSFSQNYDPYDSSNHKRRVSLANQNRNYILD